MNNDSYESSLKYLYGLEKFGMVFGLGNVRRLLESIGDPHRPLRTVHIAGTNGKGSAARMISCILKEAGFRVGKYTSPHLVSFTERITVDEEEIGEEDVASLTDYIRTRADAGCPGGFYTFFDFTTALAFEYFKRKKVDIAVIETGLGGRLDSTNVITPLASVITNVAFDHMGELGATLGKIAAEKAGIIKKGVPVVTGAAGRALGVIKKKSAELASPLFVLGKDFFFEKTGDNRLSYRGIMENFSDVPVNLNGDHQLANASLALCVIEILSRKGFIVRESDVCGALKYVTWQGRLEMVRERPLVFLDGAHNVSGIRAIAQFLMSRYRDRRKVLVFGVMKDKEYGRMLEELGSCVDMAILTRPVTDRALAPEAMKGCTRNTIVVKDTKSALEEARRLTGEKDLILVTGSFYTIGEAKQAVNEIF